MPLPAPIALLVRSVRFTFAGKHGKCCGVLTGVCGLAEPCSARATSTADPPAEGKGPVAVFTCAWAAGSPVGLMRAASDGTATSEQRGASLRKRPSIEKPDVLDFNIFNFRRKGGTPSALVAGGGKAMLSDPEPEED